MKNHVFVAFPKEKWECIFLYDNKITNYFCVVRGLFNQTVKKSSVVIKTPRSLSELYR